jgi:hypothetical protein
VKSDRTAAANCQEAMFRCTGIAVLMTCGITSELGTSDINRRARFCSITRSGRKQPAVETDLCECTVAIIARLVAVHS